MIALKTNYPWVETWQDETAFHLDVREMLEQGGEPYAAIMECVHQIANGDALVVHALFEPKPLVAMMRRMGLQPRTEKVEPDHWTLTVTRA